MWVAGGASFRGNIHQENNQPNQDAFLIDEQRHLFAVFDGHGEQGHVIASEIKDQIAKQIISSLETSPSIEGAFKQSFSKIDAHICSQETSETSGSTATVAYIKQDTVYIAAVGDCAAHLVQLDQSSDKLKVTPLVTSHKPHNPSEQERVTQCGGKIDGEYVVHPTDCSKVINITRAFGDLDMKTSCGIIAIPDITTQILDHKIDTFLILSSDGLDCVPQEKLVQAAFELLHKSTQSAKIDLNEMCHNLLEYLESSMFDKSGYFSDDATVVIVYHLLVDNNH